jgi:hypothetical protein
MLLCPVCCQPVPENTAFCALHVGPLGGGWAASNRIMCDFFHRGVTPPRLEAPDRVDDFARHSAAA